MVRKEFVLLLVVLLSIGAVSALGPQVQSYANLGNISADNTVYSCWQGSETSGCIALINLNVNANSSLANLLWNISLNNTAEDSGIIYGIDWKNSTGDWVSQSENNTLINGSNYNLTTGTHEFRINITLPSLLSTKWNVSFNINGTNYVLDPYLDSINLTVPADPNHTTDQTPDFSFILVSDNWTLQSCGLYLRVNDSGSWTAYGTNSSVFNNNLTKITADSTLSEGNYTWKVSCNVTGNSTSRWIYINDTVNPSISGRSAAVTSSSVRITWTTNEIANSSISYGSLVDLETGTNNSATLTTSHSLSISGLSSSTRYYYNVTSCDAEANCNTIGTFDFTTSATSTGGSTGGGGVSSSKKTRTWPKITSGVATIWLLSDSELGIKQINITVNNSAQEVKISVTKYDGKPAAVSVEKSGEVYKYLRIDTENLEENLSKAVMRIQVQKTWINNNNLTKGQMKLFKFNTTTEVWDELITNYVLEDSTNYYYDSELTSFSYFAIASKAVPSDDGTADTGTTDTDTTDTGDADAGDTEPPEETEERSLWWLWVIIIVVMVIVAILIVYISQRRKKYR